jgi:hypothetical protein
MPSRFALVAGQDVEPGDRPGRWKIAKRTAPDRVVSVVDAESRHTHKTQHSYRDGYKAHLAAEPETGIITATELSPGNTGDAVSAPGLLYGEPSGTEVLGDAAYGSGKLREHLEEDEMTAAIKPMPLHSAGGGGYTFDDFEIDEAAGTITCPGGITVTINKSRRARFAKHCATCPLRRRCTKSKAGRRTIVLHPNHYFLAAARVLTRSTNFCETCCQQRPMIERTIAWLVRENNRKLRYRGVERNKILFADHLGLERKSPFPSLSTVMSAILALL